MPIGILMLSFGEPADPTRESVERYLERIFLMNASLEGQVEDAAVIRARQLAKRRAPALLAEYDSIGGSPLNAEARAQAGALRREMRARSEEVHVYTAFQFTEPDTAAMVQAARDDGVETLLGLPMYPLCGKTTTVAALEEVRSALDSIAWSPRFVGLAGWHHHPAYTSLRAEHIRVFVRDRGLDLCASDTLLYFSAHGTPVQNLSEGNRYDRYVHEHCGDIAERLGADRYAVGFQNHSNRPVQWTRPGNDERIRQARETKLVVVPISFMHEQSETLAELDVDLRRLAEDMGKEFHRVPVPHDDARFPIFLADLVTQALAKEPGATGVLSPCRYCAPGPGTWCTNGVRKLPASPYVDIGSLASP